jgi:hypothetical protein
MLSSYIAATCGSCNLQGGISEPPPLRRSVQSSGIAQERLSVSPLVSMGGMKSTTSRIPGSRCACSRGKDRALPVEMIVHFRAAFTAFSAALSLASAFAASHLARSASRSACSAAFSFLLEPILSLGQSRLGFLHGFPGFRRAAPAEATVACVYGSPSQRTN